MGNAGFSHPPPVLVIVRMDRARNMGGSIILSRSTYIQNGYCSSTHMRFQPGDIYQWCGGEYCTGKEENGCCTDHTSYDFHFNFAPAGVGAPDIPAGISENISLARFPAVTNGGHKCSS